MATLKLTKGYEMLIDDADVGLLEGLRLRAVPGEWGAYAVARARGHAKPETKKGEQVDHINGNTLDNRRSNLRTCTRAQSHHNGKSHRGNSSGFKRVCWDPGPRNQRRLKPWKASIKMNDRTRSLGYYSTAEEAARAYDREAAVLHGEFARFNLPQSGEG